MYLFVYNYDTNIVLLFKQSTHVSICHNFTILGGDDAVGGICSIMIMKSTLFSKYRCK